MRHTLFTLYGPIGVHSYGLMIALGLLLFLYLIQKNKRFHQLNLEDSFMGILLIAITAGLIGGRLMFLATTSDEFHSWLDLIAFWQGGFSILGTIIAITFVLPPYLSLIHVPIVPLLDLLAIYAPLVQSIARIGCFFAGCCHGTPTSAPWGIIYTDAQSAAPLYVCLHPTQLYSAIGLMLIFAAMYFIFQHRFLRSGQLISIYLALVSLERFVIDFWRGDREASLLFSLDQQVAVILFIIAIAGFIAATSYHRARS